MSAETKDQRDVNTQNASVLDERLTQNFRYYFPKRTETHVLLMALTNSAKMVQEAMYCNIINDIITFVFPSNNKINEINYNAIPFMYTFPTKCGILMSLNDAAH